ILQDAGFAWQVEGLVRGYAANTVAVQQPAPGTRVRDTGAPLVVLHLSANPGYNQYGLPENASPYRGTEIRLVDTPAKPVVKKPVVKKPVAKKPAAKKPVVKKPAVKKPVASPRPPAFSVPGARKDPL